MPPAGSPVVAIPYIDTVTALGEWDRIHTQSVKYLANKDQDKYCVEVQRGWVAKPKLDMPDEFWKGTGYDSSLCK